jgi:PTH1 family peptidyl-tRNA hydrolase
MGKCHLWANLPVLCCLKNKTNQRRIANFQTSTVMSNPKMIVGLGNPGAKYALNRHNIGFQTIDRFARRHHIEGGRVQNRAMVVDTWLTRGAARCKVIMVKPMTYMNASGESVGALARFYHVEPEEIIVIHDDLDLEMGKLRLRRNGSSGGQNGIKSIAQHLGTLDFHRAKIGIGRPPGRMDPAAYVLQDFSTQEEEIFVPLREKACDALESWLFEGIEAAMNRYNG